MMENLPEEALIHGLTALRAEVVMLTLIGQCTANPLAHDARADIARRPNNGAAGRAPLRLPGLVQPRQLAPFRWGIFRRPPRARELPGPPRQRAGGLPAARRYEGNGRFSACVAVTC
jgi:hypothetical protein